ncbi:plasmid stabilization protein ParE [Tateyamaria omphalii]|uniref:type II toxin-antitoxin system RelE/ParE family toxin n=1 Tax=Tateyamaria omphalii TaxID=299262 RepID=UPI0016721A5B|nr:type II toxin-antitoxin system RelE/ParE family toxin [Tateyamaria omphalii]GGX72739.1 plasmid stabilization protein ParE [Tateyamaria omphalii]
MAKTYDLSEKAKADLRGIWDYTEDCWGEQQADTYYRGIIKTFELLAAGERLGRKSDVRVGYLKYPVGRHFVYFTKGESRIKVIRVLHESMDVDRHL